MTIRSRSRDVHVEKIFTNALGSAMTNLDKVIIVATSFLDFALGVVVVKIVAPANSWNTHGVLVGA